jgi:hypothetical protein
MAWCVKLKNEDVTNAVRLSTRIVFAFIVSVLVLLIFFLVSIRTENWLWLARSGSILVCIGVATASYDIKGRMEKSNAPNLYVNQTIALEAMIVIVGTLVWGFGDLLGIII